MSNATINGKQRLDEHDKLIGLIIDAINARSNIEAQERHNLLALIDHLAARLDALEARTFEARLARIINYFKTALPTLLG